MKIHTIISDLLDSNIYLFEKNNKKFMIDCGGSPEYVTNQLNSLDFTPDYILLTHGHIDHISALSAFDFQNTVLVIHPDDAHYLTDPSFNLSTQLLGKGVAFDIKSSNGGFLEEQFGIKILHTPGHSPGSVCYLLDGILFSGDTLFCNGIGNTIFPGGDYALEISSIKKLLILPPKTLVYSGHGIQTTIQNEIGLL